MKKKHAQHNEGLCTKLLSEGNYNDWVVTTAFYSALHYVQHEMFPLKENGNTFANFETYYSQIQNRKFPKHQVTIRLVYRYITPIGKYYRYLYDSCMNSRYKNYLVSDAKAALVVSQLQEIKKHLQK